MSSWIDALPVDDGGILHNLVRIATKGYIPCTSDQSIPLRQHTCMTCRLARRASYSVAAKNCYLRREALTLTRHCGDGGSPLRVGLSSISSLRAPDDVECPFEVSADHKPLCEPVACRSRLLHHMEAPARQLRTSKAHIEDACTDFRTLADLKCRFTRPWLPSIFYGTSDSLRSVVRHCMFLRYLARS